MLDFWFRLRADLGLRFGVHLRFLVLKFRIQSEDLFGGELDPEVPRLPGYLISWSPLLEVLTMRLVVNCGILAA